MLKTIIILNFLFFATTAKAEIDEFSYNFKGCSVVENDVLCKFLIKVKRPLTYFKIKNINLIADNLSEINAYKTYPELDYSALLSSKKDVIILRDDVDDISDVSIFFRKPSEFKPIKLSIRFVWGNSLFSPEALTMTTSDFDDLIFDLR